jgi:hypothetical protein
MILMLALSICQNYSPFFSQMTSSQHSFSSLQGFQNKKAGQFWLQRNTGAGHLRRRTLQKTIMSRAWRVASRLSVDYSDWTNSTRWLQATDPTVSSDVFHARFLGVR